MKIISWNCNGIKHNYNTILSLLKTHEPDYLCIQNYRQHNFTMPQSVDVGLPKDEVFPGGETYEFSWTRMSARTGLSNGVAVFTRWRWRQLNNPYQGPGAYYWEGVVQSHFRILLSGRICPIYSKEFLILNVIPPGGARNPDSPRALARRQFDDDLLHLVVDLRKLKPVILLGDFKIAAEDIDLHPSYRPPLEAYIGLRINPALRQQFLSYRLAGLYDALRLLRTREDLYSCWSGHQNPKARYSNRDLNRGWRSDYFLVDRNIKHLVTSCSILTDVFGSRNAPILMEIEIGKATPPPPPPDNPELPPDEIYWDDPDWEDTGGYSSTYDYNPYIP